MTEPSPVGEYFKELFLYKPPLVLPAKPEERPFESAFFNPRSDETDSPCGSPETTLLARFYNLHLSEDVVLKHVRHSSVLIKNIEKRAEKGIHLLEDQDPPGVCLEAMPLRFMHTATDNLERISRSAFDVNIFMSATIRPFFPYFVLPLSFRLTDYDRVWKAPLVGLSSCDAPHDMALSLREPEGSTVWDELEELLSAEPESRELLKDMIAANRTTLVTCKIKGPEMVPALVEIIQKTAQGDYEQFPRTVRSQPDVDLGPQGPVQPENGRKKSKDSSVASELVGEPIQGPRAKPIPDSCQNDVNTILQKIESKPDPNAAERILQQAWLQALKRNTTLLVISTGNCELIGVRCRKTQTLYLSDLIIPSAYDTYGKLRLGLFLSGLADSMERFEVDSREAAAEGGSSTGGGEAGADSTHEEESSSMPSITPGSVRGSNIALVAAGGPEGVDGLADAQPSKGSVEKASPIDTIELRLQYHIYDSVQPTRFTRIALPVLEGPTSPAITPLNHESLAHVTLSQGAFGGAAGVVHKGSMTIDVPGEGAQQLIVIVKLGFCDDQKSGLSDEYRIYHHLAEQKVQGVPKAFGLFRDAEEWGPHLLLLADAGNVMPRDSSTLKETQRSTFRSILQSIHDAGVVHDDIRRFNLLIDKNGQPSIIDFDRSFLSDSEELKAEERGKLAEVLGLGVVE